MTHRRAATIGGAAAWTPWGGIELSAYVAAYSPKGAASLADSYINLANPGTYNAAPGTAPSWASAMGWTFDSTLSQYLLTGIVPGSWSWSYMVRVSDIAQTARRCVLGGETVPGKWVMLDPYFDAFASGIVCIGSDSNLATVSALTTGTIGLSALQGYINGSSNGSAVSSTTYAAPQELAIGARNQGSVRIDFTTGSILAIAILNRTLSSPEMLALHAAMAAL